MLSTSEFLALGDAPPREVEVPGGKVLVRLLTVGDREYLEAQRGEDGRMENFRSRLLLKVLCRPDGTPSFSDADLPRLARLPEAVFDAVYAAATELNALGETAVEQAAKNS